MPSIRMVARSTLRNTTATLMDQAGPVRSCRLLEHEVSAMSPRPARFAAQLDG
jgi:hypothetical protein